jgi:molybdopterin-guanine dinucleotide biosynthesis protein A
MKHQKHPPLELAHTGTFAPLEWAILGATCSAVRELASALIPRLQAAGKVAFIDASHEPSSPLADLDYLQQGQGLQLHWKQAPGDRLQQGFFHHTAFALVNGNHFEAERQLLYLDPERLPKLEKRLHQCTRVDALILRDADTDIPEFLKTRLPNWQQLPRFLRSDEAGLTKWLLAKYQPPVLQGLVLAGGHSRRMGIDKGQIVYHEQPQREHLYHLLTQLGIPSFLSCRPDQAADMPEGFELLPDSFLGLGPMGALLSAFRQAPGSAWLVLACDLPFVDEAALQHLIANRNPAAAATAYRNPDNGLPEPLIAIWEPAMYTVLLQLLNRGKACVRKALLQADAQLLDPPNPKVLQNINTPEERKSVLGR